MKYVNFYIYMIVNLKSSMSKVSSNFEVVPIS